MTKPSAELRLFDVPKWPGELIEDYRKRAQFEHDVRRVRSWYWDHRKDVKWIGLRISGRSAEWIRGVALFQIACTVM